eukprot:154753-Amphidinium_carterae.1
MADPWAALRLKAASAEVQGDRALVLKAVEANPYALQYAADDLLADTEFAPHARSLFYFIK